MSARPKVSLPSGRTVLLTKITDPQRPWEVSHSDGIYVVARMRRGDSSAQERFASDRPEPLLLDRPDAEALAAALNAYTSDRQRALAARRADKMAHPARP